MNNDGSRKALMNERPVERLLANKLGILLHTKDSHQPQYNKPLSEEGQFESESEKERYHAHMRKLCDLKHKLLSAPSRQMMIAMAVPKIFT
jgi:hypothetical protein